MNIFDKLEFTKEWIDLGIVTPEKLSELEIEWNKGEDTNTEHYRWRAFRDFLSANEYLDFTTLRKLHELGENDSDFTMGSSMMVDILNRKDCPTDLLKKAYKSEEKFLRKVASRKLNKEFIP